MTQPVIYMIAGPNGAGKTTAALKLLPDFLSVYEFVNADEMARGLNPLNPDGEAFAAGRLMLERMDRLMHMHKSFAFETTGASHVFAEKLKQAKNTGYRTGIIFLWLPNADFAKQRVRLRVKQGGHNIPEVAIGRRYNRGLQNLINLYLPLAEQAMIIDSTLPVTDAPQVIAQKQDSDWKIFRKDLWHEIKKAAEEK